jgi:two-component system, NarL family, response regulator DesR
VTAFPELSFIEKAKNLKVDSFVYKNIPIEDLLAITKNTYIGYSSYPTTENENLAIFKELTEKELSILRLYCSGMNRKEIADKLCLSESTIKNYITEILLKTEYDSMAKLALYAVKNGFIL